MELRYHVQAHQEIHSVRPSHADARNRRDRPPGRRRRAGEPRRLRRARHVRGRQVGQARPGLLSDDRRLPGEDLRRGQDPRRLLQARRPSVGEGNPHLPPDRPAAAPAVPGRLLQRSADRRHRDVGGPRDRSGHPGDDRRLRRRRAFRHPAGHADRRRARRLRQRPVRAQSDEDRARDVAARPGRRRHRSGRADGRVRGARAARGSDARRRGVRPPAAAGGHRADSRARRGRRQAAVGLAAAGEGRGDDRQGRRRRRSRPARRLPDAPEAGAAAAR